MNQDWYQQKHDEAAAKAKAAAEIGDYEQFQHWSKEAENYKRMLKK